LLQNFPVFPACPQEGQVQGPFAAGFALPQLPQNFPVFPACPQEGQVHPAEAACI